VATEKHSSIFDIFMKISDILQHYDFSNVDGSTYGEVAAMSFDNYINELHMADMKSSREKTIEAIVLGERMRSVMLYTEAFVHGWVSMRISRDSGTRSSSLSAPSPKSNGEGFYGPVLATEKHQHQIRGL